MSVAVAKLLRAVQMFREVGAGMLLRVIEVFVAVAEEEGVGVTELAHRLQITSASASRTISALSDRRWIKDKPGLGLVSATRIGRATRVELTPKGRVLIESLVAVLKGQ